mgnify:CR=1 FL=1
MTRINLLPWREELRKERLIQFVTYLVIVGVIGAVSVLAVHMYNASMVSNQRQRNEILNAEIKILDKQIKEIKELEAVRASLTSRMEVIQDLQAGRPGIVHLFDEFVTTLPDGVHLTSLQQSGKSINIKGKAQSNARVSEYMENLDASDWLTNPKLSVIQGTRQKSFNLSVKQQDQEQQKKKQKRKK